MGISSSVNCFLYRLATSNLVLWTEKATSRLRQFPNYFFNSIVRLVGLPLVTVTDC